jgi:5-methylcytosine-specific restriction enzyme A
MRIGLWVIFITIFFIMNTYHDGKYTAYILNGKKYYKMLMYGFIGLSIYMFLKKHPMESKKMFLHANSLIRHLPVDKNTKDILSPILDFTNINEGFNNLNKVFSPNSSIIPHLSQQMTPQTKRMMNSGKTNKRSVSESKKKYVASNQNWKCGRCQKVLDATYEIDHKVELQHGGSNQVSNLEALCRNCHGIKTLENRI